MTKRGYLFSAVVVVMLILAFSGAHRAAYSFQADAPLTTTQTFYQATCSFSGGTGTIWQCQTPAVPAGKTLVIETITGNFQTEFLPQGGYDVPLSIQLATTVSAVAVNHDLSWTSSPTPGGGATSIGVWNFSNPVHLYGSSGTVSTLTVTTAAYPISSPSASISGYLM